MLSPPSRMCSPTATRCSSRLPSRSIDRDQREVGRAAADVDDEDHVADAAPACATAAALLDPAIERGLRFFEQRHAAVAGGIGGFGGQFARGRIERRGDRHRDVLLGERRVGMRVVPCFAQVRQIAHRDSSGETRVDFLAVRRSAGSPRDGRRPDGTASFSRSTRAGSACPRRGCARIRRPRIRARPVHGRYRSPGRVHPDAAGRGTTAAGRVPRWRRAP